MAIKTWAFALCASLALAGCGDTFAERSLVGAGAGAGAAALLDGNREQIALGALLGAAGNVGFCSRNPSRC
jgi:glucokinase